MSKRFIKNLNKTKTVVGVEKNGNMFGGGGSSKRFQTQPSTAAAAATTSTVLQSHPSSLTFSTTTTTSTIKATEPPHLLDKTQQKRLQFLTSRSFLPLIFSPTQQQQKQKTPTIKQQQQQHFSSKELPCISLTTTTTISKKSAAIRSEKVEDDQATQPSSSSTRIISPSEEMLTVVGNVKSSSSSAATVLSGKAKLLQQGCHTRQRQQQQYHHLHHHYHHHTPQIRFRLLPGLKITSFFTILTLVCLETVLLSTVSNCAKTFYMHWNTSNSIFRIDNTDHIIDVNKGNLAFEFDQVHIICPVYEPGTFENETEKYIIYNVSKVEYETCRITNADPRVIAICDKPQRLMFFTITFRPFTPQPGGLEFLPGNDYYFISTSSKDDLYRRIGGRCSTNNMKVVFKVCCAPEDKNNRTNGNMAGNNVSSGISNNNNGMMNNNGNNVNMNSNTAIQQQQHNNNININGGGGVSGISGGGAGPGQMPMSKIPVMGGVNNGGNGGLNNGGNSIMINGNSGTSINTNIDQYNRIPMQQPNNIGGIGIGIGGGNGNMGMMNGMGGGGGIGGGIGGGMNGINGQHSTGIRINNVPSSQQHPSQKNDDYDKHPNEVVKNEELTYNSAAPSLFRMRPRRGGSLTFGSQLRLTTTSAIGSRSSWGSKNNSTSSNDIYQKFKSLLQLMLFTSNYSNRINSITNFMNSVSNCNPIILTTTILVTLVNLFQYKLSLSSWTVMWLCKSSFTSSSLSSSKVPPTKATTTTTRTSSSSDSYKRFYSKQTSSSSSSPSSSSSSPPPKTKQLTSADSCSVKKTTNLR